MQKIIAGITRLWNAGCLGKLAIGLIGLLILGCCGAALGGRRAPQQAAAPITLATPVPATAAPLPTSEPVPTSLPVPTSAPAPTEAPTATAKPQPTAAPARTTDPAGVPPLNKDDCPPDYPVKGNIGNNGKIYHMPGAASYSQTDPERCFATAADAEAAGFRAPAR